MQDLSSYTLEQVKELCGKRHNDLPNPCKECPFLRGNLGCMFGYNYPMTWIEVYDEHSLIK